MTVCVHCRLDLPPEKFYRNSHRANGLSITCKDCYRVYEGSPDRRAKRTWNTIHTRVELQQGYAGVKVNMGRKEFLAWAIPEYTRWMAENPGQCPSLDRIDPAKDYCLGNLQILERGENCRRSRPHKNVNAPTPEVAWCCRHKEYLPKASFQRSEGKYNGLQGRCRECQSAATRESLARRRSQAKGDLASRPASP